jgi:hypothetical protein
MSMKQWFRSSILAALAACGGDSGGGGQPGVDAGSDAGEDASLGQQDAQVGDCLDLEPTRANSYVAFQSFEAAEHAVSVTRARQPGDRPAIGETIAFDLVGVRVVTDDDEACVSKRADLTYTFAHHNWDEEWSVRTAKARYVVREVLEFGEVEATWVDTLEARALEDDHLLWGPIELSAVACWSEPYDYNPCIWRTRSDQAPEP